MAIKVHPNSYLEDDTVQRLVDESTRVDRSKKCKKGSLDTWFTTFSVGCGWVGVLVENKAISAFNYDVVEVEAELGNRAGNFETEV